MSEACATHSLDRINHQLLVDADPHIRASVALSDDLSTDQIETLATDVDWRVRASVLNRGIHAYRLSPSVIDGLLEDPEPTVRCKLIELDGLLDQGPLRMLAKDSCPEVRIAVARNLIGQRTGARSMTLSSDDLDALSLLIFGDHSTVVRHQVVPALPVRMQFSIGVTWLSVRSRNQDIHHLCKGLARRTQNSALMHAYLTTQDSDILGALASNLYLPTAIQLALIGIAKRLLESSENSNAHPPKDNERLGQVSPRRILSKLVENDNVSNQCLRRLAQYCVDHESEKALTYALLRRVDLDPSHLKLLQNIRGQQTAARWANCVLKSRVATRRLTERALRVTYECDPELIQTLESIGQLSDKTWWGTLVRSKDQRLVDVAAQNVHLPTDLLLDLASGGDEYAASKAAGNPSLPIDHTILRRYPDRLVKHPRVSNEMLGDLTRLARNQDAAWLELVLHTQAIRKARQQIVSR